MKIAAGEDQKCGPVGFIRVAAIVLAEGDVSIDQGSFHGWQGAGSRVFFAKKFVDGTGGDGCHERSRRVGRVVGSRADG